MVYVLTAFLSSALTVVIIALLNVNKDLDLLDENIQLHTELNLKSEIIKNKNKEISELHKKYKTDRVI